MKLSRPKVIDMSDYNPALRVYWWAGVSAGLIAIGWGLVGVARLDPSALLGVFALMGLAALASLIPTRIPGTQVVISPGDVFVFVAALLQGPPAAILVAVSEALCGSFRKSQRWTSRIGGPAFMAVAICVSANLFTRALAWLNDIGRLTNSTRLAALFAFSMVYYFLNTTLVAAHYALKNKEGLISHWREKYSWTGLSYLAGAATAGFVYLAILGHAQTALLAVAPLVAVIYAMIQFYFKQAEEKVRAHEQASLIVNNTSEAIFALDSEGRISYVNPAIKQLIDYTVDEALNMYLSSLVHPDDAVRFETIWRKVMGGERSTDEEFRVLTKTGKTKWCSASLGPLRDERGRQAGVQGHLRDISEHKALQSQLVHSQKMEAVGLLAGGIAHDFNNLLTAMIGYSQMALVGLGENHPVRAHVKEFLSASNRAASLTRQLLAFARRQTLQPVVLDLNSLVNEVDQLLRRLLGSNIELLPVFSGDPAPVKADPGQIEQVIVNLAVNARDAMPDGGILTIQTANLYVAEAEAARNIELPPGDYVMLSVSDTGCGMEAETSARIFEPFFTTKEVGKGTGLGLAMVYGFVKQSGGHITVESEVGRGATFRIFLPRAANEPREKPAETARSARSSGTETILVVDDDEAPRKMVAEVLRTTGYHVLQASDAGSALQHCGEHDGPIHLMVTDLVMPQVSGLELAERVAELRPGMKVMFMSGQPDVTARPGVSLAELPFLQKPFSVELLSKRVREILDQSEGKHATISR